jgi:hypothetical protein
MAQDYRPTHCIDCGQVIRKGESADLGSKRTFFGIERGLVHRGGCPPPPKFVGEGGRP